MADFSVSRDANHISIRGVLRLSDIHRPLAAVHQAINDAGYEDIVLDFRECTAAFAGPMLGFSAQAMKWREAGIGLTLKLPIGSKLSRLFKNANWAHFLDPRNYDPSNF